MHQLQLDDDFDGNTTDGFNLPPPPPPPMPATTDPDVESDFLQTPLMFSRGTSSYLSSGPLGTSPGGAFQSSPQSECSDPAVDGDGNLGILTDLETSAGSKCIVSPVDSVIEETTSAGFHSKRDASDFESDCPEGQVAIHTEEDDEDEVRLPFAEEGTPQDAISFVEDSALSERVRCAPFDWHAQQTPVIIASDGRVDEDDDEPGQAQILQQCIASAMPGNSSFTPLRTEFPATLPAPAAFASDITRTVAFVEEDDNDSVRNFAVEDTPFGTSTKASSLSDLIVSEAKSSAGDLFPDSSSHHNCGSLPQPDSDRHHLIDTAQHSVDRGSSSSSINGETSSDLLSEVIQSAMPKSFPTTTCDSRIPVTRTPATIITANSATTTVAVAPTSDGDCLQLYAVEGTPGADDLSGSSSVHDVCESAMHSFTSHSSSMHGLPATSPALASASYSIGSLEAVSAPPAPPRRTTSVLTNQRDPFAPTPAPNRPQATVAPMPQVARCPPTNRSNNMDQRRTSETEFSDVEKTTTPGRDLTNSGLLANVTDKDDASSFSSLLSIESVGLEHSLLQECISSAMPRPKVTGMLRKPQQIWSQLRTDFGLDESLPEQDESHLAQSGVPQSEEEDDRSGPVSEAAVLTRIKSDKKNGPLSAPLTQRSSALDSSGDSSRCSSVRPKSVPECRTDPNTTNMTGNVGRAPNTTRLAKSSGTAIHFLDDGSDGAPPRHPCSSSLATKSWTSPRLAPPHPHTSHGNDEKGTVSASSEISLPSGEFELDTYTHMHCSWKLDDHICSLKHFYYLFSH
ncbi:unnamed protein product [Echinostoma caproni]|uniref:Uncharacterized protein n=1 Tax=Echinostoma caproni TaxID=27848 RepID=A0A3P8IEL4_9TREM|nr:unnamed protein product [Echinostoma caproni]